MTSRSLALAVLLLASPSLGGDRPERVSLEPGDRAEAPAAFTPADHPVATTFIVAGAVLSALLLVTALATTGLEHPSPVCSPGAPVCR